MIRAELAVHPIGVMAPWLQVIGLGSRSLPGRLAGAHGSSQAMNSDLVDIFLLGLLSMFNPTLLAAVTVMLLLPSPKRLMAGYLLGAYTTSITLGLVIVFTLQGSGSESTSKHAISPAEDIVVGLLAVVIAF